MFPWTSQKEAVVAKQFYTVFFLIQDAEGRAKAREEKNFLILREFSVTQIFQHNYGQNSQLGQHIFSYW